MVTAKETPMNPERDPAADPPPLVLLHGWPHTSQVWDLVTPLLSGRRRIIAPDLRGADAATGAADILGLLDALDVPRADLAAIDASVPAAFVLGATHPERVRRLTLMEATLPGLPGGFPNPPWWFGFHAVPGLAETVLAGHEREYLEFFLPGVPPQIRDAFVRAHSLRESLTFYRTLDQSAAAIRAAGRLTVPTLALGGSVVGDRLHQQLKAVADDLTGEIIEGSGHIIPLDRPDAVASFLQ
jgi:pimeloyl-ACP methyl ester carboxylesterase